MAITTARPVWRSPSAVSTVHGPLPERRTTSPKPISTPAAVASSVSCEAICGPSAALLVVVQRGEIDQRAARRKLVEAESLQPGAGDFGGGGETGWAGADDDDIERG